MSSLFDKANMFSITRRPNIYQSTSVGGYGRVERNGLSFYYVEAQLPPMYESDIRAIHEELMGIDDGAALFTTTIPNEHTFFRGSWAGNPTVSSSTGRTVNLTGATANRSGIAMPGDWIQFSGNSKVYQVVSQANSNASGNVSITVHTDFVSQPTSSTTITRGGSVQFRLLMTETVPPVMSIPGVGGKPLYTFATPFSFREVL